MDDEFLQPRQKQVLTVEQAIQIYKHKIAFLNPEPSIDGKAAKEVTLRGKSMTIAGSFNVSAKTIRDIWNRRTWYRDTCHLWRQEEGLNIPQRYMSSQNLPEPSTRGRPKGSKDSRPRKRPAPRARASNGMEQGRNKESVSDDSSEGLDEEIFSACSAADTEPDTDTSKRANALDAYHAVEPSEPEWIWHVHAEKEDEECMAFLWSFAFKSRVRNLNGGASEYEIDQDARDKRFNDPFWADWKHW